MPETCLCHTTTMCVQELAHDDELRVVLAGHSVGAYIVTRLLAQLPREKVLQVMCTCFHRRTVWSAGVAQIKRDTNIGTCTS